MQNLAGRRIMIVEDDYYTATDLAEHFRIAGARVMGPFATIGDACPHSHAAQLAVLDLNLRGGQVYPLADRLLQAAIPFVFYSGQDMRAIPPRFAHIARLPKPRAARETVGQLQTTLPQVTISALLPKLRLAARLLLADPVAADRLVEATFELALADYAALDPGGDLPAWLHGLMARALAQRGRDLMH